MLAPIGLTVYSRLDHLRRTIQALQENTLASESELHIFSDGPRPGDEQAVDEVRRFAGSVDGFADVVVTEREGNSRLLNNRGGQQHLLDRFGRMIWMAEDIVTAPGFLAFMNAALDRYREEDRIISVSGYAPVITLPSDYSRDVYYLKRFSAWGFGIWKDRYERISGKLDQAECKRRLCDRRFYRQLASNGQDIPGMVRKEIAGAIDALDVRVMYQQAIHNWYTVYPGQSLVQNIGHDGSGLHCGADVKFHHHSLWDRTGGFAFPEVVEQDDRIVQANREFRRLGMQERIVERMKLLRLCLSG